ncbi:nucleoside-triphosphate phosphatase [Trifolium repens]|nr:nucleoside-triphosphate phosphatase [Trifolium repens]
MRLQVTELVLKRVHVENLKERAYKCVVYCGTPGRQRNLSMNQASQESHRWPNVGNYKVDVASFETLALPELQVREDTDLFIIDEVGKMELYSSSFFPAVLKVLESNIPILASIPVPKFGRDIPAVTFSFTQWFSIQESGVIWPMTPWCLVKASGFPWKKSLGIDFGVTLPFPR